MTIESVLHILKHDLGIIMLFNSLIFRGDDLTTILQRVNNDVSMKEASSQPGEHKQMPEVRFTLRKSLVLSPSN